MAFTAPHLTSPRPCIVRARRQKERGIRRKAGCRHFILQRILEPPTRKPKAVPGSPPTVVLSARAEIASVLNVADPTIQQALGTNLAELTAPWRLFQRGGHLAPTQLLAQTVFQQNIAQAIRYPSAIVPGRCCFVVFCDLHTAPSLVEVYDPNGNLLCSLP